MARARKKKLRLGVGATCSVFLKYMHSKPVIAGKYPNFIATDRINDLNVIKREVRKVNRKDQMCIIFTYRDFDDVKIYYTQRFAVVTKEETESEFFTEDVPEANTIATEQRDAVEEEIEVPRTDNNLQDTINEMRALGITVDDDNEAVEENLPTATDPNVATFDEEWTGDVVGIYNRRKNGMRFEKASVAKQPSGTTRLDYFRYFSPIKYFEEELIPETNKKIEGKSINLNDLFVFIGLILFMSLFVGCNRNDFFSDTPIDLLNSAPIRLSLYMSGRRFNQILKALSFTSSCTPSYQDKFWEIRKLIAEWNDHMKEVFIPSWISCLDESMSPWTNKFTCPGFIFCPRKPHPKGNEYHSIACGMSRIMYEIDL